MNTIKPFYILCCLLLIDTIFIVLHILYSFDFIEGKKFKTSYDGGYGEIFQYIKFVSTGIILLYLSVILRSKMLIFWASLAIFLFLDDWKKIHESLGGKVMGAYLKPLMKDSYHYGQAFYGIIAGVVFSLLAWHWWKTATKEVKKLSVQLFSALALIWFSAVVIDYIHAIYVTREYNLIGVLLEEGGEHLGATLMLWFSYRFLMSRRSQPASDAKPPENEATTFR